MTLIATKSLAYGGRRIAAGEAFEAKSARDARTLKAIGKAKDAEAEEPAPAAEPEPKARKGYKRRDLTAEE